MEHKNQKCVRCGRSITSETWSAPASGFGDGRWCLPCYTFNTGFDRYGNPVAETLSATVLADALRKAQQAEADDIMARKNAIADTIIQNIDALLLLVPKHSRTSCSDEKLINTYQGDCTRCVLLQAEADGFWRNDLNMEISLTYDSAHATVR